MSSATGPSHPSNHRSAHNPSAHHAPKQSKWAALRGVVQKEHPRIHFADLLHRRKEPPPPPPPRSPPRSFPKSTLKRAATRHHLATDHVSTKSSGQTSRGSTPREATPRTHRRRSSSEVSDRRDSVTPPSDTTAPTPRRYTPIACLNRVIETLIKWSYFFYEEVMSLFTNRPTTSRLEEKVTNSRYRNTPKKIRAFFLLLERVDEGKAREYFRALPQRIQRFCTHTHLGEERKTWNALTMEEKQIILIYFINGQHSAHLAELFLRDELSTQCALHLFYLLTRIKPHPNVSHVQKVIKKLSPSDQKTVHENHRIQERRFERAWSREHYRDELSQTLLDLCTDKVEVPPAPTPRRRERSNS